MSAIQRPTKASNGGSRSYGSGKTILAAEVNADLDTVYNDYNGSIADTNISGTAAIALSKLAAAASHTQADDPGVSGSENAASNVSDELEQLRYAIERLGLGIDATRVDGAGAGTTQWFDLPARGSNLLRNPMFVAMTGTAPDGWTISGGPTLTLVEKDAVDGDGPALRVVATAADEGVTQLVDGLKAATRYLAIMVVRVDAGTCDLTVNNPDVGSSFRSFTKVSSGTGLQVLKGVVQTDATPTSLNIRLLSNAAADDFEIQAVGLFECGSDVVIPRGPMIVHDVDSGTGDTYTQAGFVANSNLSVTVYPPGPNYAIKVTAVLCGTSSGGNTGLVGQIMQNVNGAGATAVRKQVGTNNNAGSRAVQVVVHYVNTNPTVGVDHVYTVQGRGTDNNVTSNGTYGTVATESTLTVELVRMG